MRRFLLSALALLLAGLALAAPGRAEESRLPVRILAPAPGTEFIGGALATLEWEAREGGLDPEIVEWEAFLSLDGGRTWPLRLTPHLEIGLRRFSFRVPGFPSRDARLLLRFGDEREETEVDVPGSFTISSGQDEAVLDPVPPSRRLSRGESARPGDSGVILWTEGTRDGSGLREVAADEAAQTWEEVRAAGALMLPLFWPAAGRGELPPPKTADLDPPEPVRERDSAETAVRPAPATRVLIHRYNV
jgi:hypothetical protein